MNSILTRKTIEERRLTNNEKSLITDQIVTLTKQIAYKAMQKHPNPRLKDDIMSAAMYALVDAAKRYSEDRGSFRKYVVYRIKGNILDLLRKEGIAHGFGGRKDAREKREKEDLQAKEEGRSPKHIPTIVFITDLVGGVASSFSDVENTVESFAFAEVFTDPHADDPAECPITDLIEELIKGKGLTKREKMAFRLYFGDPAHFVHTKVAKTMGCSFSQVSNLIKSAIKRIRQHSTEREVRELVQSR